MVIATPQKGLRETSGTQHQERSRLAQRLGKSGGLECIGQGLLLQQKCFLKLHPLLSY